MSKTLDEFMREWEAKTAIEEHEARQALAKTPGICTVVYHVYFREHRSNFDSLLEAFKWAREKEQEGACYVEKILLSDGSELNATPAIWHIVEDLEQ